MWFLEYDIAEGGRRHATFRGVVATLSGTPDEGGTGVIIISRNEENWRVGDPYSYGPQKTFAHRERQVYSLDNVPDDICRAWALMELMKGRPDGTE